MARQADAVRDQIEQELTDPLRALGLDVEAVELTPAGNRLTLESPSPQRRKESNVQIRRAIGVFAMDRRLLFQVPRTAT